MASAMIHLAVAKKVNEMLKINEREFYLGAIAPDAAKIVGIDKKKTHFITNADIPEIEKFLKKYQKYIKEPFELGYLVHLITDELWYKEFIINYLNDFKIINKDGNEVVINENNAYEFIYNDYTNLNAQLLDYYDMDLSLFYEKFEYPISNIKELPQEYFEPLINKMGIISMNSSKYNYLLNIEAIVHFIEYCSIYVLDKINNLQ